MTSLNSSHLRKTFILVVGLVLCLVSSAFAGGGGGGGSINLMMGKTLAGGAATGFAEGVPAQNVAITPNGVATDAMGNVYVGNGNAVLKIDARMRTISTVAGAPGGSAAAGYVDGAASSAMFSMITALATDAAGNVYIADAGNNAVRMLNVEANTVCTIAANSASGANWCFGPILSTMNHPTAITAAAAGNMGYIADQNSNIYRIDSAFTQVAGTGTAGYGGDGGAALAAQLNNPLALALDGSGNLFIADSGNNLIREITTSGNMVLVAGLVISGMPQSGYLGDGGSAVGAALSNPTGIIFQPNNGGQQLIFIDTGNSAIRAIQNGQISTLAPLGGMTLYGLASLTNGGVAVNITSSTVFELGSFLDSGAAYVGSAPGALTPTSTTFTAQLTLQQAMTVTSIGVAPAYLASRAPGAGFTVGTITGCTIDGTTQNPSGTTCSVPITFTPQRPGVRRAPLFVRYNSGSGLQKISYGMTGYGMSPSLGSPSSMSQFANFSQAPANLGGTNNGVSLTGGTYDAANNFYVTTGGNHTVWMYNSDSNCNSGATPPCPTLYQSYTLIAGQSGVAGYSGDGGQATSAQLNYPSGVTEDPAGNIYIADTDNCRIRVINVGGSIQSSVGGGGGCISAGDGGDAGNASTLYPKAIYADALGNIFFAEDARVRVFNPSGNNTISTYAGGGSSTSDNIPATQALLAGITSITLDRYGNLYMVLGSAGGNKVRKVDSHGYITTVQAGTLLNPVGVAIDQAGFLFISDAGNSDVLRVDLSGTVSVIAGTAGTSGSGCGGNTSTFSNNTLLGPVGQLVSDAAGDVYILNNNPASNYVCEIGLGFGSRSYTYHTAAGQSSTTQTNLYNNGNLGMTLSGINFTGGAFSQATAPSPSCGVGTNLPVGSSCNFNVQFTAPAVQKAAYTGTLTLTDGAYSSPQNFTLTGYSVGAESQLAFTNAPYNSFTLGASGLSVSVQIQDSNGNSVPSTDSITLTVTFPDSSTQTQTKTTGSGGAFSFSLPASMFTQTGQYSLVANDNTNTGVSSTPSTSFTVNPKPNSFQVSAPSPVTAGSTFSFTVTATQWSGTTATTWTGYTGTVSFGLSGSAAGASLPGSYTFTAADGGVHTFTATINTAGTATLMVSDSSNDTGSVKITVNPGAVNRLNVSNQVSVTGGVPFLVTVTAQDNWVNTVTEYDAGTIFVTQNNSLHARQGTVADPGFFADSQERMRRGVVQV